MDPKINALLAGILVTVGFTNAAGTVVSTEGWGYARSLRETVPTRRARP